MTVLATDTALLSEDDCYREHYPSTATRGSAELTYKRRSEPITLRGPAGQLSIEIDGDPPAWLSQTANSIAELLWLPRNWDSYNALPIDMARVGSVLRVLLSTLDDRSPAPSVVPLSNGGIQIEWHRNSVDLEIESISANRFGLYFADDESGESLEDEFTTDLSLLRSLVSRLSNMP